MKKMLLLTMLVGCTYYTPPPDKLKPEWEHKGMKPDRADEIIDLVRNNLPCTLRNDRWSGTIRWVDGPISCEGARAAGCWDGAVAMGAPIFSVTGVGKYFPNVAETALIHELGHYGFMQCGQQTLPDYVACAKAKLSDDACPEPKFFIDWVEATKQKARVLITPTSLTSER